ncbi:hypothetical protein VIBNISOn1_1690019 [Vibrio nigripulchritudo SOn1]|uniref:GIY-YIG domain-containing protein n=1 Tax=Vibrio nigripulchritudo SOn1 TaxID=1238450 RepID=A0AAV2VNB7_9VIBR|nr:NUDIX hydrolase [Vibrio nigripulchritudo]CCO46174.1 hypothetical protein VIBNISOn1_1690019 [Vibrio nigripulchritudo SOn1]
MATKHYLIITDSNKEYVYVGTGSFGAAEKDQRKGHHFPGGSKDGNEDFKATLVREVSEEFGTEWGTLVQHSDINKSFHKIKEGDKTLAEYYTLALHNPPEAGKLKEDSFPTNQGKYPGPRYAFDPAFSEIIKLKIKGGYFIPENGENTNIKYDNGSVKKYSNGWHKIAFEALLNKVNQS